MAVRLSELKQAASNFGITLERPSSGSHYKFKKDSVTFPVPAHNGLRSEIADVYVKKLCKAFDIDRDHLDAALDGRAIPAARPPSSPPAPQTPDSDSDKLN